MTSPSHVPVLLDRVVALLAPALDHDGAVLVDATLGLGGHTEAVLQRCALARVVGIDRDTEALALAGERLASYNSSAGPASPACTRSTTRSPTCSTTSGSTPSTPCSSTSASPLSSSTSSSAASPTARTRRSTCGWTARPGRPPPTSSTPTRRADLARVLKDYGEERFARQIARAVVKARETAPFTTSARLVELLYDVIPAPARRTGGHPAKRTFQALRMEVNDELAVLRRALPAAIDAIAVGGRVVVESYHSLEDRLVKRAFADATRSDVPDDLPFVPGGPRAGLPAGDPRRRAGRRRRGRPQPARRQRPAARPRTTHPFPAPRSRIRDEQPRLPDQVRPDPCRRRPGTGLRPRRRRPRAGAADRRPADPHPHQPAAVRDAGVVRAAGRCDRAADVQHLDAAGGVHRHDDGAAGRHPQRPRADPAHGARRPPRSPARGPQGPADGPGHPRHPGVPAPLRRQGARDADPGHPRGRAAPAAEGAQEACRPRPRAQRRHGGGRRRRTAHHGAASGKNKHRGDRNDQQPNHLPGNRNR